MLPAHIELVKATVPVLRESGVALTTYFYQRMLKHQPELQNIFNMDHQETGRQPRALAAAVLAYAEHIDNPAVLAKAVERITTKHVSLNIQPEQYAIVGEHLLHSISEVLNVSMDAELIAAWKAAYMQLAELLISIEQAKYTALKDSTGGWSGWREFKITQIETIENEYTFTLSPTDNQAIATAQAGEFITLRAHIVEKNITQPQQFTFDTAQSDDYQIRVQADKNGTAFSVENALINHYKIGDVLELSAPAAL